MNTTTDRLTVKIGTALDGTDVILPLSGGVIVGGRAGSGKTHLLRLIFSRMPAATIININGKSGRTDAAVASINAAADRARQGITGEVLIIEESDGLIHRGTGVADALDRLARVSGAYVLVMQRPSLLPYAVLDTAVSKVALGRLDERDAYALFGYVDLPAEPLDRSLAVVKTNETITAVTIA